ncbi:MAG: hypothetical protein JNL58_01255 [Planctomyces sp.]|nr:hypothetical protein [Planctomyces sp.]
MRNTVAYAPILFAVLVFSGSAASSAEVRDRAVLSLQFDDPVRAGDLRTAADTAKNGAGPDAVSLPAGGSSLGAAFSADRGNAVVLTPTTQQIVSVVNSGDINRPEAVTVSGLFASLHPLSDNSYHGLFAKRHPAAPNKTNFGINYTLAGDVFQAYVNDGSGYKAAVYSAHSTIGSFRRVHVTAVWQQGDAPGTDADTDLDDIRIRLYINGTPIVARSVSGGIVDGNDAWLNDVQLPNCQSDTPLTIGGSFAGGELTQLACDEFHVFSEALSDADAALLFRESAGSAADQIAAEVSSTPASVIASPVISAISQRGLQIGKANSIEITGQNLTGATLRIGSPLWPVTMVNHVDSSRITCQIEVPAGTVPGRYLLRAVTNGGTSQPLVISVDGLTQLPESQVTQAAPLTTLPVAVSGVISGTEQKRVFFHAKAGQKISAEVEARRIGSMLDPVVEIKNQQGGPIAVQWQQPDLAGDARATFTVPADGLYFAEVHDLQYRAPGGSSWRLLLGELPGTSSAFPPVLTSVGGTVRTLGSGGVSDPIVLKSSGDQILVESGAAVVPLGGLSSDAGPQVVEPIEGTFDAAPVDAAFTVAPYLPLSIHGRISEPGQTDQIVLTVTAKQTLYFQCRARSSASPLRPEMILYNGEAVVASSNGDSGASDPAFAFTVPDGVTQLKLLVREFTGRGSPSGVYRVNVSRTDRPSFSIQTRDQFVAIPANGSTPLRLSVVRQTADSRYTGPIRLSVKGLAGVTIEPEVIAASDTNQDLFVLLTRSRAAQSNSDLPASGLTIEGRTEGLEANISRELKIQIDDLRESQITFRRDEILAGTGNELTSTVSINGVPPILFRGMSASLPLRVYSIRPEHLPFSRFRLQTTEAPRKQNPADQNSPEKPGVSAPEFQFVSASSDAASLLINVPLDVAEPVIEAIVSADFVHHPLAQPTGQTAWTAPVRMLVENAVQLSPSAELRVKKGATAVLTVPAQRHPLFGEPVQLVFDGLPQGVTASAVACEPGQSMADLTVAAAAEAVAGETPTVTLRVVRSTGEVLYVSSPIKLIVE